MNNLVYIIKVTFWLLSIYFNSGTKPFQAPLFKNQKQKANHSIPDVEKNTAYRWYRRPHCSSNQSILMLMAPHEKTEETKDERIGKKQSNNLKEINENVR